MTTRFYKLREVHNNNIILLILLLILSLPFSLGIIMAEVLTMDVPFNELMDYAEIQDIIDAIAGRRSLKQLLPATWTKNTNLIRPDIPDGTDPKFAKVHTVQALIQKFCMEGG
jgi:hypothetical protein